MVEVATISFVCVRVFAQVHACTRGGGAKVWVRVTVVAWAWVWVCVWVWVWVCVGVGVERGHGCVRVHVCLGLYLCVCPENPAPDGRVEGSAVEVREGL